jgi:hypothetical protein
MNTGDFRYPTTAEIEAYKEAARRERSQEIARLIDTGVKGLKSLAVRLVARLAAKEVSHA